MPPVSEAGGALRLLLTDRGIAAFFGRAKRSGLCQADQPPVT